MNLFKPTVLRYESLASTNNEVARLATQGAEEGLAVVAEEQTAGRGRLQRTWTSPKGAGLYFSILLRPKMLKDRWPLITLLAAVAVGDALWEACELRTDIKWPNDLLAGERKICGILAEVIDTRAGRAIVLGIGINLTSDAYPEELKDRAVSVAEASGGPVDLEAILRSLLKALSRWYSIFLTTEGSEEILKAWIDRSSYANGKFVRVANGDELLTGITRGLELDGALRLEVEDGSVKTLRAGDVISVRVGSSIYE